MTLASTDFAPLVTAISDNAAVIVGVIASVAGLKAVFTLVKRYTHI